MDALDWFRAAAYPDRYPPDAYPWTQFLRHAVYCTNFQGSALYDATLGDQELIEQMYTEAVEEQSAKRKRPKDDETAYRPSRRGYTREVEALQDLQDNIVALRAEMGRWPPAQLPRHLSVRPLFPGEVVKDRMGKRARSRRDAAIARSQERWRKENAT